MSELTIQIICAVIGLVFLLVILSLWSISKRPDFEFVYIYERRVPSFYGLRGLKTERFETTDVFYHLYGDNSFQLVSVEKRLK